MPKSKHQVPGRVRSAYEFIKAHRDRYSVQMMCRVLEVAPSGYYDWLLGGCQKFCVWGIA
jgi:putative transposase